ncbi:MAG: hypothetical protein AABZ60_22670 [Planctomycetota bacterium]
MKVERLPKVKAILGFLKSRGWTLVRKTDLFFVLAPPASLQIQGEFYYHIPLDENYRDYKKYISNLVNSFSELYEIEYDKLFEMLSESKEEMKQAIEMRRPVLDQAS